MLSAIQTFNETLALALLFTRADWPE